jgi:NitT/TauT family transport system ATP-binding protein
MMNNSPLLQCNDVRKAFPKPDGAELLVLAGLNLALREGQIVGLLGRSARANPPVAPDCRFGGALGRTPALHGPADFRPAPGIAMVFQSFALFPG